MHLPPPFAAIGSARRVAGATPVAAAVLAALLSATTARGDEPLHDLRTTAKSGVELERDFDLDADDRDRVAEVEALLRLGLTVLPGRPASGFVELEAVAKREWEDDERPETARVLRLNQAFLRLRDPSRDAELRLGRWLFRDEGEWLFDENIDGARLTLEPEGWTVDLLAGRVNAFRRDLLDRDTRGDRVWELAALADRDLAGGLRVGGYAVARLETEGDGDRPLHLGLRAAGAPWAEGPLADLELRADAGVVRGRAEGRRLSGWGFDVGALHRFDDLPGRPRLQIGYAFGSGDDDAGGTNRAFRQTGLHSNEAGRGSLAKYKYYGEALDPELSNLGVLTLGVGASLGERASVDVIYHRYRKHRAGGDLRDIALSADADRPFRDVGDGIDVVLGLRPAENVEIEAVLGLFHPGRAFRERDRAVFARVEVEISF